MVKWWKIAQIPPTNYFKSITNPIGPFTLRSTDSGANPDSGFHTWWLHTWFELCSRSSYTLCRWIQAPLAQDVHDAAGLELTGRFQSFHRSTRWTEHWASYTGKLRFIFTWLRPVRLATHTPLYLETCTHKRETARNIWDLFLRAV